MRRRLNPDAKDTFVVTRGEGPFIVLYPLDYWDTQVEPKLEDFGEFDSTDRVFIRHLYRWADEVTMDGQGRIQLPKTLTEFAGLAPGDKAMVIGAKDRLEVWNGATLEADINEKPDFGSLATQVTGRSIPPATAPTRP